MKKAKHILVVATEDLILESLCNRFTGHPVFNLRSSRGPSGIAQLGPLVRRDRTTYGPPDLIVLIRYGVNSTARLREYTNEIGGMYKGRAPKLLFVENDPKRHLKRSADRSGVFPFSDLFEGPSLETSFDRLLDTYSLSYDDRVRIADRTHVDSVPPAPTIPDNTRIIVDRMCASHMFSPDREFPNWHVVYSPTNHCDFERDYDAHTFDPNDRYVESVSDFHQALVENERRVTYLLLGHRGCGKSSFLRHYFQQYELFQQEDAPYIIVDFLNYHGLVEKSTTILANVISSLHQYAYSHDMASFITKFPTIQHLFPQESLKIALSTFQRAHVPFSKVISDKLFVSMDRDLDRLHKVHIGRRLRPGDELSEPLAIQTYRTWQEEAEWDWIAAVCTYLNLETTETPFRYFANWIMKSAFDRTAGITYADTARFGEALKDWRVRRFRDHEVDLSILSLRQLEEVVESFLDKAASQFGRVYIALDNLDQHSARNSEYQVMRSLYGHLARVYAKLKVILSVRPSTYFAHERPLQEVIPEDTTAYHKYWLHKVSLRAVLDRRLHVLEETYREPDQKEFTAKVRRFSELRVLHDKRLRASDGTPICDLISGVTGNNLRDGLELFADLVVSRYPYLHLYSGPGLLRRNVYSEEYIAEHIAVRATFLTREGEYAFRQGLVNLFHVPELESHESSLIQVRLIEVMHAFKRRAISEVMSLLRGLGYSEEAIDIGLDKLDEARLLSRLPGMPGGVHDTRTVLSRYRGDYYFEHLIGRLSYLQMVYFMTLLPRCFAKTLSYPDPPSARGGELEEVLDNFLHALWVDIALERRRATREGIERYETEVRKLADIHSALCLAYQELDYIHSD